MAISVCGIENHICFNCAFGAQSAKVTRLFDLISDMGWGEVTLMVKEGKVTMIKGLRQDIKLDEEVSGL